MTKRVVAFAWLAAITTFASAGSTQTVRESTFTPDLLARLSRSVVKVRSGDDWETGFVFGDPRHVVTSYFVANESSDVEVVAPDQGIRKARVVAWSKKGDLALLELASGVGPPLAAASASPWAPQELCVLYEPQEPDPDSSIAKKWNVPVALRTTVGRVLPDEIDMDVTLWGRPGDLGAPVIDDRGEVVGVVSHRGSEARRPLATRVAAATRLFAARDTQGEFSRSHSIRGFGGLFVPVGAPDGFVGAGADFGTRYSWFVLELAEALMRSSFVPTSSTQSEEKFRAQFELEAEINLPVDRASYFFFGPALQLNLDVVRTITVSTDGQTGDERKSTPNARPAAVLGVTSGPFLIRASISSELRVDFGLLLGR